MDTTRIPDETFKRRLGELIADARHAQDDATYQGDIIAARRWQRIGDTARALLHYLETSPPQEAP